MLLTWSSSLSPVVQAAIVAAVAGVFVCIVRLLWNLLAQLKIEKIKTELQTKLETSRDAIEANKERISALINARNRWKESAATAPSYLVFLEIAKGPSSESFWNSLRTVLDWTLKHGYASGSIFDDVKYYLDQNSISSIQKHQDELANTLLRLSRLGPTHKDSGALIIKIKDKNFALAQAVGKAIDLRIADLFRARLADHQSAKS